MKEQPSTTFIDGALAQQIVDQRQQGRKVRLTLGCFLPGDTAVHVTEIKSTDLQSKKPNGDR